MRPIPKCDLVERYHEKVGGLGEEDFERKEEEVIEEKSPAKKSSKKAN